MKPKDRPAFIQSITTLAVTLDKQLSPELFEGYWIALQDLAFAGVQAAMAELMRSARFFPKPIEIRELIRRLATERTVILSTHILPEVAQICQKVVIISNGAVALEKSIDELTSQGSLEEEYLRYVTGELPQAETPDGA